MTMLSMNKKNLMSKVTGLSILFILSTPIQASGTFSPSNNGGSKQSYHLGKKVFHKKLACKDCLLPKKSLSKDEARQLIQNIDTREEITSILNAKEREATKIYLTKRYKLQ